MIVTCSNFARVLERLRYAPALALDCETYGLRPFHGDRVFSTILSDGKDSFYFSQHPLHASCLPREELEKLYQFLSDYRGTWYGQHFKFDMHHLANYGVDLVKNSKKIHCTMTIARIVNSGFPSYSLDYLASAWLREKKDDKVKAYIEEHDLWEWETVPGRKARRKNLHFDRVPEDIIIPYAEKDAMLTYVLAEHELRKMRDFDVFRPPGVPSIEQVYENECKLLKTVYRMEQRGVMIDRPFCSRAMEYEDDRMERAKDEFWRATEHEFKASRKLFEVVFEGEKYEYTDKGNASFKSDVLSKFSSPLAKIVLEFREAKSNFNYYSGFLHEADAQDVIHTSLNQHGAATGRFSSSSPNLQNMTKTEGEDLKAEFVPRRAIIPRPGHSFQMLDYDQVEYRLMLEYAKPKELTEKVLNGLDVHQATADLAGISRSQAKTTNFTRLYGGGEALIAERLNLPLEEAQELCRKIDEAAPEISQFSLRVRKRAEIKRFIYTWYGRRIAINDRFYAGPNYLIQGGCADIIKIAMVDTDKVLETMASKLALSIHDEGVFEIKHGEEAICPELKRLMEAAYPSRLIPLTVGVEHSHLNLADKVEGLLPIRP